MRPPTCLSSPCVSLSHVCLKATTKHETQQGNQGSKVRLVIERLEGTDKNTHSLDMAGHESQANRILRRKTSSAFARGDSSARLLSCFGPGRCKSTSSGAPPER